MPCVEVWQTSNLRPLRLGEEKKEEDRRRRKKLQGKNIMPPLLHRAAIISVFGFVSLHCFMVELSDGILSDLLG